MPIIVKSPKAKSDLVEIWSYIADDSEIRADAFIQTIDKKFHSLINVPFLGIARDEIETDLRSFPVGRYVIFYRRIPEGIEIIRVLHGARDLNIIFNADN
jgi:toxin ParE1/3/4